MSVPGAGLLALLRRRNEAEPPQPGVVATAAPSGGSMNGTSSGSKFEARSSAVHALEHAVASGTVGDMARPAAQGRRIPPGPSYTYDVDVHAPHEAQPQLPVNPITLINTDYALHHYRQIAVNSDYICYGLKQGHIRVLSRHSAVRALLKGHTKPLTDLAFVAGAGGGKAGEEGDGGTLLASGGQDSQLYVWHLQLDQGKGVIQETQQLRASFVTAAGPAGDVLLSWHEPSRHMLAVGVGGKVLLVAVPSGGMEQLEFELDRPSTPDATVLPNWSGEAVTCLSFSPNGQLLAAGGANGSVCVWQLPASAVAPSSGTPMLVTAHSSEVPVAFAGTAVGAVRWLPTGPGCGWTLLTGNHNNAALQLWHSRAPATSWELLQSLQFEGEGGQAKFFNHVELVPGQGLVVLADTARKAIYTLHLLGSGADLRFDYVARFGVAVPILSFTALWNPAGGEQGDIPLVELDCVQTTAVQQYSLHPAMCHGAEEEPVIGAEGAGEHPDRGSSVLERHCHGQELGIWAQPSTAVPMPSKELASGTPLNGSTAVTASPAAVAAAERAAEPMVAADASEASKAEVPPLPEPSIEAVVPLTSIPPPPGEPLELNAGSGDVTPEECPSPPPTPTEQQQLADDAAAKAGATSSPVVVAPPPPRLLTPSDFLQSGGGSSATASSPSPSRGGPSPKSRRVLQRPASATAVAAAATTAAAASTTEVAAAEEEGAAVPPPSPVAPAAGLGLGTDAAVAAAIMQQMGGMHKKFVGHVSLMYRELLKALKSELGTQAVAQQQATMQLLTAALEEQKQQIEAERAAVLAEERVNIERLLTAISGTLNRELPAKLAEAVRGEVVGVAEGVAAAVAPAVQLALAASLPKEVVCAVKGSGLDKALAPALAAGLGKPLQEAFRTAFSKQLVPAFESATQAMFQQVNTALATGLEEHVQASKSALSEPTQLAAQLASSLSTAQTLAATLSQGQQQLLRAQSIGTSDARSPMSAVDVRGELSTLLLAGQYEAVFSRALGLQDVATVGWLAAQVDATSVLAKDPCPLSQMVLLSLVQQLSANLTTDLAAKLAWIREAAMLINPADPLLARHLRPVLEGVHAALQVAAGRLQGAEASNCRLAMHVVHSQLTS